MKFLVSLLVLVCFNFNASAFKQDPVGEIQIASLSLLYGTPADLENVWKKRKSRAIANLQTYKDGIICLQEVNETQIKDISKGVSGLGVVYRTRGLKNGDGNANAIFYNKRKWKLIEDETFWLSDTPTLPESRSWGNTLPRIATVVVLENKADNTRIRVLNTLLDHRSESSRLNSIEMILAKLEGYKDQYPTFLVGGFNVDSEDVVVKKTLEEYSDTYTGGPFEGCTFHSYHGGRNCPRIDYIFYRNADGMKMNSSGIDRYEKNRLFPSDHYLIYAKFSLK
ncbi:endonuclease/exonuclease/phosphatase family protein [Roseivirga echinicomitans]